MAFCLSIPGYGCDYGKVRGGEVKNKSKKTLQMSSKKIDCPSCELVLRNGGGHKLGVG